MSENIPDLTAILDDLFIGNLAAAKTLHEHPELGITHVLSVCPECTEVSAVLDVATASDDASYPTISHHSVSVQDSEYEDILVHLPSAVAFIKDAIEPSQDSLSRGSSPGKDDSQGTEAIELDGRLGAESSTKEASNDACKRKNKVLVHCVMGISRSSTVVCAYLMATRQLSFPAALMIIRRRRPQVHPNYGFRRQLQIFGECDHFANYHAPIRSHPAFSVWQRKKRREIARYLTRVGDVIEVKLEGEEEAEVSFTDDFPTDALEASSLLSEVGATHFLTISPASLPALKAAHLTASCIRRPSGISSPLLSRVCSSSSSPDSPVSSPFSSRSSSFSYASQSSASVSGTTTAATSVNSLPSLLPPSKLRLETSLSDWDSEEVSCEEPDYLALAGVEHYLVTVNDSDPNGLLFRLNDTSSFIRQALREDRSSCSDSGSECDEHLTSKNKVFERRKHVLIHSTTESRACAVVCAFLMFTKGLSPTQAYNAIEKAQPLFNPTKSFVTQLELYHDCKYNPSPDHPLVQAQLCGSLGLRSSSNNSLPKPVRPESTTHWKIESDTEGDTDSTSLRRKIGTPMRCGSFSTHSAHPLASGNLSQGLDCSSKRLPSGAGVDVDVDVEALLNRCAGVGDPQFAFDVEAFRGTLRGIAADTKNGRNN